MVAPPQVVQDVQKIVDWAKNRQSESPVAPVRQQTCYEWLEANYYIPPTEGNAIGGRPRLIKLLEHQKIILHLFFEQHPADLLFDGLPAQTLVFSTVKKSGKTAIAGGVARWVTETWGSHVETYSLANDEEQARGRIYAAAIASIELDPRYNRKLKGIPGAWRIIDSHASYIPTYSTLKAVSSDYKGEAGSNPVATFWSELWGYTSEASKRLWSELTPVPTRPRSIRYVETYAGYENESGILNTLEDRIKDPKQGSRRIELDELRELLKGSGLAWPKEWENQKLPFFVHKDSRTMAYWDEGYEARRMPWQTEAYYKAQAVDLTDAQNKRLHLNIRTSQANSFIDRQWWDRLHDPAIPPLYGPNGEPDMTPVVIAADGSVSGDCTALAIVSRDKRHEGQVWFRGGKVWTPQGGPLDYSVTIKPQLRQWLTGHIHPFYEKCDSHSKLAELGPCIPVKPLNVVQVPYDLYQLHDMMTELKNEGAAWCYSFSQSGERNKADKQLYDLIKDQRIHWGPDTTAGNEMGDHLTNCAAKIPPGENTRMHIVKKAEKAKIDYAVCLSMASHECLRLNL
jgi:phage terminase large subunit-like protein